MSLRSEMTTIAATASKPPRLLRRTVTLDDGDRVGVAVCGDGVPLVMIDAPGAEGILYARMLRRIAGLGFRVIAPDGAGNGSTHNLGRAGYSWDTHVELHRQALDALGIRRAVIAGHSMGGKIAVDLAAAEPDRALAVVAINAPIGGRFDTIATAFHRAPAVSQPYQLRAGRAWTVEAVGDEPAGIPEVLSPAATA